MSYVKLKVADIPYRETTITIDDFSRNRIFVTAEDGYQMDLTRPRRNEWTKLEKGMKKKITIKRTKKAETLDKIENYYAYIHVIGGDNEIVPYKTKMNTNNREKEYEDFINIKVNRNVGVIDLKEGVFKIKIIAIYNTKTIINIDNEIVKINTKSLWNPDFKAGDTPTIEIKHIMGSNHKMYGKIKYIY